MTREEAIKEITRAYEVLDFSCHMDNHRKEAFNMAKVALEQEPCEDARSLAQVFEILGNLMSIPYDFDRPINKDDVGESMDAIRALPPVIPTRKSGLRWIERFDNEDKWLECPHCHMDSTEAYNYCPNCGADMRESEGKE